MKATVFASILILATPPLLAAPVAALHDGADQPTACVVRSTMLGAPKVHPDLMAVASQYFHPGHRGGYDAFRSSDEVADRPYAETAFPWFDVQDLAQPVTPPAGIRIVMQLRDEYFVTRRLPTTHCCEEELGLWKRSERVPRWLGVRLYPESAVQTRDGEIWAITRGQLQPNEDKPPVRLLHIGIDGKADDRQLDVSDWARDAELVLTAEDRPALAFLRRSGDHLRLWLSWSLDASDATVIDEVEVAEPVAELSQRTGVSLAVAADGLRGIGVAWRPLTDKSSNGSGDVPTSAEVRWLTVEPEGEINGPRRSATIAQPLSFVNGQGPFPLSDNGLQASEFTGHAFFVWNERHNIVGVRSSDDVPTPLASSDYFAPALQLRPQEGSVELILLNSSPSVSAFQVHCSERRTEPSKVP
jgi:hypothetical protein